MPALREGLLTPDNLCQSTGWAYRPLLTLACPPGGPHNDSWPSRRAYRPLTILRKGVPIPPGPSRGPLDPSQHSRRASQPFPTFR